MTSRLHSYVLDQLGGDIVAGRMPPGTTVRVSDLTAKYSVSLAVAREAVRVLQALGLVSLTKRIGVRVLPASEWNTLEPLVIRWRLESPDREAFLHSLAELRRVVEPEAARLAAERASDETRARIMAAAEALLEHSTDPAARASYFDADVSFHALLLSAGGNPVFRALEPAMLEALRGRAGLGVVGAPVDPREVERHLAIARAVLDRDPSAAERAGRELLGGIVERLTT